MQKSQEYTVCRDKPPRSQNEASKSRNWTGTGAKNNQQGLIDPSYHSEVIPVFCAKEELSSSTEETQNL